MNKDKFNFEKYRFDWSIGLILIFLILTSILLITWLAFVFVHYKTIPTEVVADCDSGYIGIWFHERFVFNESNERKPLISYNPDEFRINGINNIHCKFRITTELPREVIKKYVYK